jgi:hypothetical protein
MPILPCPCCGAMRCSDSEFSFPLDRLRNGFLKYKFLVLLADAASQTTPLPALCPLSLSRSIDRSKRAGRASRGGRPRPRRSPPSSCPAR